MKKWYIAASLIIVGIAIVFTTMTAQANKYKKMKYRPITTKQVMMAEKNRSLTDCMTFAASHVSKGRNADRAEFKRQFGPPQPQSGSVWEYNYDQYVTIALDCSKGRCSCRCLQKY